MRASRYNIQSTVITLLFVNVVIFLFSDLVHFPIPQGIIRYFLIRGNQTVVSSLKNYGFFITFFSLFPVLIRQYGWVWQIFTYMFLHGSLLHIFFNMYALYLFGKPLEDRWGSGEFLLFYLFTGVGAGIVTFFWNLFRNPYIPTIGASGALFGVILAFGLEFPETILLLFFIIPVKARYAVFIFGGIELVMILTGTLQRIGHFTHLAGILFGYLYYIIRIQPKRVRPLRKRVSGGGNKAVVGISSRSIKKRKRLFEEAREIKERLQKNGILTSKQNRILKMLHEAHINSGEMCEPDEFNPLSPYCMGCNDYLSCLYRWVVEGLE